MEAQKVLNEANTLCVKGEISTLPRKICSIVASQL